MKKGLKGSAIKKSMLAGMLLMLLITAMITGESNISAERDYSTIRVRLSVSGTSMEITTKGDYNLSEKPGVFLEPGKYTLRKTSHNEVHIKGAKVDEKVKDSLTLIPRESSNLITLKNTIHGTVDYLGLMQFISISDRLEVVNHVPFEKYLYGVVAYEMNNSFPLEALKAQAVTARGYGAARINGRGTYDVVDTEAHQVYKGYNPNYSRVLQAVKETQGEVLKYQGKLIDTYYAASNGGQTELPGNTWGGGAAKNREYPYLVQKDDPYDLRNPRSLTESFFVPRTIMENHGITGGGEVVRITTGEGHLLNVRSGPGTSYPSLGQVRRDTLLPFIAREGSWYKVWYQSGAELKEGYVHRDYAKRETIKEDQGYGYFSPVLEDIQREAYEKLKSQGVKLEKQQDVKLLEIPSLKNGKERYPGTGSRSYVSAEAKVMIQYVLRKEEGTEDRILSEKKELSLDLVLMRQSPSGAYLLAHPYFNGNLRMRRVEEADEGYRIINSRFGHGVGMSQRGAEQMAIEGKTHEEILAFYFEGTEIITLDTESPGVPLPPGGEKEEDDSGSKNPSVSSDVYTIEEEIITRISPKTSLENFMKGLSIEGGRLKLTNEKGEEKTAGNIATGDKLKVYKEGSEEVYKAYQVVIYGDINGDGDVSTRDLLKIRRHLLELETLKGSFALAADLNRTGSINTMDLLSLRRHLLEIETIKQ